MHPAARTTLACLAPAGGALIVVAELVLVLFIPDDAFRLFAVLAVFFQQKVSLWAAYAFFRSRKERQEELLHAIAAAVEAKIPLVPAIRAFNRDGPTHGDLWEAGKVLVWVGSWVALPLYAYIRMWAGLAPFRWQVDALANRLAAGQPLSYALRAVRGATFREARLAAAVGEATGELARCLRAADRERASTGWLEVGTRVLYPLAVLAFVSAVTAFLMVNIIPRFKKIFDEFGMSLPPVTVSLVGWSDWVSDYWWAVLLGLFAGLGAVAAVIGSPGLRWHTPVVGRLYRWGVQSEVLRALGMLLGVGRTVPAALEFLEHSPDLPAPARRRLEQAREAVLGGAPLADALGRVGLLPASIAPLVRSAERAQTLPWALGELGDHLAGRAVRVVKRASQVVGPLLVVAVGAVVGFVALGMFTPLIKLLSGLAQ